MDMLGVEELAIVFDRDNIDTVGISPQTLAEMVEALRVLAEYALRFRLDNSATIEPPFDPLYQINLIANPVRGSIRFKLTGIETVAALSLLANLSTVSGLTLKDTFAAISASQVTEATDDPITQLFVTNVNTTILVDRLYSAAAKSGCSYVAVELGNEAVVLHGGESARLSLIASEHVYVGENVDQSTTLWSIGDENVEVFYKGKPYRAYVTNVFGQKPQRRLGKEGQLGTSVLVWASRAKMPPPGPYSLQMQEIDRLSVTHGHDLPASFRQAQKVYIVSGAAELDYR